MNIYKRFMNHIRDIIKYKRFIRTRCAAKVNPQSRLYRIRKRLFHKGFTSVEYIVFSLENTMIKFQHHNSLYDFTEHVYSVYKKNTENTTITFSKDINDIRLREIKEGEWK